YLYLSRLVTIPGASGAFLRLLLDQEWFPSVLANWQLWIPFQFLNFRFVPQQFQVLAANVVALAWNENMKFDSKLLWIRLLCVEEGESVLQGGGSSIGSAVWRVMEFVEHLSPEVSSPELFLSRKPAAPCAFRVAYHSTDLIRGVSFLDLCHRVGIPDTWQLEPSGDSEVYLLLADTKDHPVENDSWPTVTCVLRRGSSVDSKTYEPCFA
ncbi:hypothetical protein RJ640_000819, partial [Escallonia rubra]